MKDVDEYYKRTISNNSSKILKKFWELMLNENISERTAIDLGCGAGNDVIYLLNNGFKVTAIDKENKVVNIINDRIEDSSNLNFIIDDFENIKLPRASLILANFSLFFCKPKNFDKFMKEIVNKINQNGYFVRKFSWKRRPVDF